MHRPFTFINVAATADGKIDTFERRGAAISSAVDKQAVDRLRASAQAIMVGARTLHDEDPRLTVRSEELRQLRERHNQPPNPMKVAVASRLHLRRDCRFLTEGPSQVVLFTTRQTEQEQLDMLRELRADVHVMDGERVDLARALDTLKGRGVDNLMVEGGATLNFALLEAGLVDQVRVYVAPLIFGGETAPTLAGGLGLPRERAIQLELVLSEAQEGGGVLLHYNVVRRNEEGTVHPAEGGLHG
jgi:2,5-diamino-6-(ribosylamino)-4(3H)-pyrimidinone 5'-phosphate reductase